MKIAGYGPWTLTLGSDREHKLQMLQASLYGEVQRQFSERGCLAFLNRNDEYFAVSSGLSLEDHVEIQKHLGSRFETRLAMSVGRAETPYGANVQAFEAKSAGTALCEEYLIYGWPEGIGAPGDSVTIMHMDVEGLTASGKTKSPYQITREIFSLYARMSTFFMERKSLAFFMGGDNFMIVSHGGDSRSAATEFIRTSSQDGIALNCGIGHAASPREAALLSTKALDTIRQIRDSGRRREEDRPSVYEMSSSC